MTCKEFSRNRADPRPHGRLGAEVPLVIAAVAKKSRRERASLLITLLVVVGGGDRMVLIRSRLGFFRA